MPPHLTRLAYWMAVGFLTVAVLMTSTVGWRFAGPLLALGLALVTIGAAILPSYAHHAWNAGHKASAALLGATAAVFAIAEYGSHVSYAVTHRSAEVQTVGYQATAYTDGRASIASLEAKEKALTAQARWESRSVADVVADIEKAELSPRWTSTDGCKDVTAKKSREFCVTYKSLLAEKANAEEAMTARAELEAVQANLAKARETSETKVPGVSMASTTDTLIAQLATLSLEPTDNDRKAANIGIGSWLALAFALGAGVFWFIAHMPGLPGAASAHPAQAEHPDLVAALQAAHARLKAAVEPPLDPSRRRVLTGQYATPAAGIQGIRLSEAA